MTETNGFIKLPRKVFQARARLNIPPNARQILDVIDMKTYGWNKESDWISYSQIEAETGIKRPHISKNVAKLEAMNLITVTRTGNSYKLIFKVQPDTDLYKPLPKQVTVQKTPTVTRTGNELLPEQVTKVLPERVTYNSISTKATVTKETTVSKEPKKIKAKSFRKSSKTTKVVVKSDHQNAIDHFCDTYEHEIGSKYLFNGKRDGEAFRRLLRHFGLDRLKMIIDQIFKTQDKWIREKGVTVGILQSCANQLNQEIESGSKIPGFSAQSQQNIKNIFEVIGD